MLDSWIFGCNVVVMLTLLLVTLPGEAPYKKKFVRSGLAGYVRMIYTWLAAIGTLLLLFNATQWIMYRFMGYLPSILQNGANSNENHAIEMQIHEMDNIIMNSDIDNENPSNSELSSSSMIDNIDKYAYWWFSSYVEPMYNYLFMDENANSRIDNINILIKDIEWRIEQLIMFLIICVPCRYILALISVNQSLFLFSNLRSGSSRRARKARKHMVTTFELFEKKVTSHILQSWLSLPSELLSLTRIYQLFTEMKIHTPHNVRRDQPALIITNHALGHLFDVAMMVYSLYKNCGIFPRVLVSPSHFNIPLWSSLIYRLGGAPRTRESCEILMAKGETILVYASHREYNARDNSSNMVWDSKRKLYLDLVHKYNYVVIPAVCVSNEDVLEIVYNINNDSDNENGGGKRGSSLLKQDTSGHVVKPHRKKHQRFQSLKTVAQPLFGKHIVNESVWERKLFHLHFGKPIYVPYDEVKYELMKNYRNHHELVIVPSKAIAEGNGNSNNRNRNENERNSRNSKNHKRPARQRSVHIGVSKTPIAGAVRGGRGGSGSGSGASKEVQNVVETIMNQRRRESRDKDTRKSSKSVQSRPPQSARFIQGVYDNDNDSNIDNKSEDGNHFKFDIVDESNEVSDNDNNNSKFDTIESGRENRAHSVRYHRAQSHAPPSLAGGHTKSYTVYTGNYSPGYRAYSPPSYGYGKVDSNSNNININNNGNENRKLERRWSRELEIRLKNAVEEAMTDGIVSMYKEIRKSPDLSLMKTVQDKLKHLTKNMEKNSKENGIGGNIKSYLESSDDDEDQSSDTSDDVDANNNGVKVEQWLD